MQITKREFDGLIAVNMTHIVINGDGTIVAATIGVGHAKIIADSLAVSRGYYHVANVFDCEVVG